ncbi:MAG: hypothetical protein ABIY55_21245 [Kofleriaceae bacterium]
MHDESGSNPPGSSPHPWGGRGAWLTRVVQATLCLLVHGCDTVQGGAVELSWKLRPASSSLQDKFVDCDSGREGTGPVTAIRLHWQVDNPGADPGATDGSQAWRCTDNHGVTGFALAEGTASLWVTPECMDGTAAANTYIAPAIVQRSVIRGDTVSLGAIELIVSVAYCATTPCICGAPVAPAN